MIDRLYAENRFGGFTHDSHWMVFYSRVNALIEPEFCVLDFGAGRGWWLDNKGYRARLGRMKGKCRHAIGVDIDPAVLANTHYDEVHVIEPDGRLPLPDESVDLIVSWAVFEHIRDPGSVAAELDRVLRPGGYICAWTPNKYAYFAIFARIVPNRFHYQVLSRLGVAGKRGRRMEEDVFPTYYRLNTRSAFKRAFPPDHFIHGSYGFSGPPAYHGNILVLALLWKFWHWIAPSSLAASWHVFLGKR